MALPRQSGKHNIIAQTVVEILTPTKLLFRCPACFRRDGIVAHTVGERWECKRCGGGGVLVLQPDARKEDA
jgi:ribosomal protein L37AE/L43A